MTAQLDDKPQTETEPDADSTEAAIAAAMGDDEPAGDGQADDELGEQEGQSSDPAGADDDDDQDDDDDDQGDDDDDDEPDGVSAMPSEAELEKAAASLGKEADRHFARVVAIMGDAAGDLVRCELCHPSIPGLRYVEAMNEELRERVKVAIGIGSGARYRAAVDASKCETCDGLGSVLSGSEVPGQITLRCLSCGGRGWSSASPERQGRMTAAPAAIDDEPGAPMIDENTAPPPLPDLDPWGTTPDDPEYGMMPQYRTSEGREKIAARNAAG